MSKQLLSIDSKNIEIEHLNGIYCDLADLLGTDAVLKIYEMYRGQQMTLPVQLFNKEYILCRITGEFNGYNIKQLATKFGYSEKWVRKILKDYKEKTENKQK